MCITTVLGDGEDQAQRGEVTAQGHQTTKGTVLGSEPSLCTLLVLFHFEASSLPGCQEQAPTLEEEERPVLQCDPPVSVRVRG